jgi:uncharacterized sulfatase
LLESLKNPDYPGNRKAAYTITHKEGESIRTLRWRYNRWGTQGEELYDHESDPHEFTNLANQASHSEVLNEMRTMLSDIRERSKK